VALGLKTTEKRNGIIHDQGEKNVKVDERGSHTMEGSILM
jgi:hypothetical protein